MFFDNIAFEGDMKGKQFILLEAGDIRKKFIQAT